MPLIMTDIVSIDPKMIRRILDTMMLTSTVQADLMIGLDKPTYRQH